MCSTQSTSTTTATKMCSTISTPSAIHSGIHGATNTYRYVYYAMHSTDHATAGFPQSRYADRQREKFTHGATCKSPWLRVSYPCSDTARNRSMHIATCICSGFSVRPSVRLSLCLSHSSMHCIVTIIFLATWKRHHSSFLLSVIATKFPRSPQITGGALNGGGI